MTNFTESLKDYAFQAIGYDVRGRNALGIVTFAVAAAFSAQIAVPLPWTPVPVTLQPMMVILAGAMLGPRLGAIAMTAYVTFGAMGAPVFSNGGAGLGWLFGPTGGYLLAAPAAAFLVGMIAGRSGQAWRLIAGLLGGVATMYVGGVLQLMAYTGLDVQSALMAGVVPFVIGDLTKIGFAFFAVLAVRAAAKGSD
ncbi:MAG: biotin transporter BioY [Myxococcales bacterium]|nr:biotin transporter BioY [Myxococcales bacterium]|tara:strand:+ start:203 stop:787 length:585 start_codon:yes stop_codon:yes gene_type:complete